MKIYKSIITVILTILIAIPSTIANAEVLQQALSASLSLTSPIPNPALTGGDITFELAVNVANSNPGVAGIEVYLSFDPALVTPPTTPNGAAEVLPDFFGASNVSINEVLPAAQCPGAASPCVHLVLAGPAQTTQNGVAARFHFRGLAVGSACFTVLQSNLVNANGFQVVHTPATQQCVTVQYRGIVNGVVQRQGVPASPNTGAGTTACSSVTAIGAETFGPVNTNNTSGFKLTNLSVGAYTVRATYPGYLTTEKTGVSIVAGGPAINLAAATLRGGDVNGDNAINILDIGAVISKFGRASLAVKSASANCTLADEPADINDDGQVNISDLAITAGNWGSVGPVLWP